MVFRSLLRDQWLGGCHLTPGQWQNQHRIAIVDIADRAEPVVGRVGFDESVGLQRWIRPSFSHPSLGDQAADRHVQAPPESNNAAVCAGLAAADEFLDHARTIARQLCLQPTKRRPPVLLVGYFRAHRNPVFARRDPRSFPSGGG